MRSKAVKDTLRWMINRNYLGGKHMPEGRIFQRWKNLSKSEHREAINEWEFLIKQLQWVFRMKKTGDVHVTLNSEKRPEIIRYIKTEV